MLARSVFRDWDSFVLLASSLEERERAILWYLSWVEDLVTLK